MGRYARSVYGIGKYGVDLRSEQSVEPMYATIEVDPYILHPSVRDSSSLISGPSGKSNYDRVEVSWMHPVGHREFVLMRSNVGFPTGPTDPWAKPLIGAIHLDDEDTEADPTAPAPIPARRMVGDPINRDRVSYEDVDVEQGREYFYAVWVRSGDEGSGEDVWDLAGRAMVTTSTDHDTLETLKASLPAFMWNRAVGAGEGVAVLNDDDDENTMSRWLQACAWELDKVLTRADMLRQIWDPQHTPAIVLDEAISMFGLPVEPSLGARSARALLANAAHITGDRGTLMSLSLLVESLAGVKCDITMGKNLLPNTTESSFEGLMVEENTDNVESGTGRWFFTNAKLTRLHGPAPKPSNYVARDPNPEDYIAPFQRFGVKMEPTDTDADVSMSLGEKIRITDFRSDEWTATVTTEWPHGLETGDEVTLCIDGESNYEVVIQWVVDPFKVQLEAPPLLAFKDERNLPSAWFTGGKIPVYQGVPLDGDTLYVSGMFRAGGTTDFSLKATYWDADGTKVGEALEAAPTANVGNSWTQISTSGEVPEGAVSATLSVTLGVGVDQFLAVDELYISHHEPGAGYDEGGLVHLVFDTTSTPTGGEIPFTIQGDMIAVLEARLSEILVQYLPTGTAFRLEGLDSTMMM